MDSLDVIFDAMRVQSVLHARLEASAPWGLSFRESPRAKFGLVVRGACWLEIDGEDRQLALTGGDCFVLLGTQAFTIRDRPRTAPRSCDAVVKGRLGQTIEFGGGGDRTTLISGWFDFDPIGARPLLDALPQIVHARMDCDQSTLLQSTFQLLAAETAEERPGSSLVLSRLGDVLFIHAIRAWLAQEDAPKTGWLAALSDRQIGNAMKALHADIARGWTVEELAASSAMSRSAFAQRFKTLVGLTPMEFLVQWRIYQASARLRRNDASLAEIASSVGYDSEAAFNRAFKRIAGKTPGEYRRQHFEPARISR